jgi:superfamily II DNA helicase RecQ
MLRNVIQYCENKIDCKRVQVLAYFNESFSAAECKATCDNCSSGAVFEVRDYSQYAVSAIKLVRYFQENNERVTLLYCVDVFRGAKKLKSQRHAANPCYKRGSTLTLGEAERLFYRLLIDEALSEENFFISGSHIAVQYVKMGSRASEYVSGQRSLLFQVSAEPSKKDFPRVPTFDHLISEGGGSPRFVKASALSRGRVDHIGTHDTEAAPVNKNRVEHSLRSGAAARPTRCEDPVLLSGTLGRNKCSRDNTGTTLDVSEPVITSRFFSS